MPDVLDQLIAEPVATASPAGDVLDHLIAEPSPAPVAPPAPMVRPPMVNPATPAMVDWFRQQQDQPPAPMTSPELDQMTGRAAQQYAQAQFFAGQQQRVAQQEAALRQAQEDATRAQANLANAPTPGDYGALPQYTEPVAQANARATMGQAQLDATRAEHPPAAPNAIDNFTVAERRVKAAIAAGTMGPDALDKLELARDLSDSNLVQLSPAQAMLLPVELKAKMRDGSVRMNGVQPGGAYDIGGHTFVSKQVYDQFIGDGGGPPLPPVDPGWLRSKANALTAGIIDLGPKAYQAVQGARATLARTGQAIASLPAAVRNAQGDSGSQPPPISKAMGDVAQAAESDVGQSIRDAREFQRNNLPTRGDFGDQLIGGLPGMAMDVGAAAAGGPGAFAMSMAARTASETYANAIAENPQDHGAAMGKAMGAGVYTAMVARLTPQVGEGPARTLAARIANGFAANAPQMIAQSAGVEAIQNLGTGKSLDWQAIMANAVGTAATFAVAHGLLGHGGGADPHAPRGVSDSKTPVNPAGAIENGGAETNPRAPTQEAQGDRPVTPGPEAGVPQDPQAQGRPPVDQTGGVAAPAAGPAPVEQGRAPVETDPVAGGAPGLKPTEGSDAALKDDGQTLNPPADSSDRTPEAPVEQRGDQPPTPGGVSTEQPREQLPQPQQGEEHGAGQDVADQVGGEAVGAHGDGVPQIAEPTQTSAPQDATAPPPSFADRVQSIVNRVARQRGPGGEGVSNLGDKVTIAAAHKAYEAQYGPMPLPEFKRSLIDNMRAGESRTGLALVREDLPKPELAASATRVGGKGGTDYHYVRTDPSYRGPVHGYGGEPAAEPEPAKPARDLAQTPEPDRGPGKPTSIKNEQVDKERAERRDAPMAAPPKRAMKDVWDSVVKEVADDPALPERTVQELKSANRPLTDREVHILTYRRRQLRNQEAAADKRIIDAGPDGDAGAVAERAVIWDKLRELDQVGKEAGTANARGLSARQLMIGEDYSVDAIERRMSSAQGGEPLSAEQHAQVKKLAAEKQAAQEAYDKLFEEHQQKMADMQLRLQHAEAVRGAAKQPKMPATRLNTLDKLIKAGDAAGERLRAKFAGNITHDITDIAKAIPDFAIWTAGQLAKLTKTTGKAVGELRDTVKERIKNLAGDEVLPHFDEIWDQAEKLRAAAPNPKETIAGRIKERAAAGEPVPTRLIQALHRMVVAGGVTDREAAVDAVHEIVKGADPSATRQGTANAMAGYGDFKGLSKDADAVQVRAHRGELRELGKLDDLLNKGEAPKKSGVERPTPTDEERRLSKQVEAAKKKLGIQPTDPETQLKSTIDGIKTRLRNETADLDDALATGKVMDRPKDGVPWDQEAKDLKARRDESKAMYDEAFGTPEKDPAKQAAALAAALDKRIAKARAKLDAFDLAPDAKRAGPPTEAVAQRRAALDLMNQQRRELRNLMRPKPSPDQAAVDARRTAILKSIADKADRIARGDYAKRPTGNPAATSRELERLGGENERLADQIRQGEMRLQLKNRSRTEKSLDFAAGWRRFAVLSSPTTIAKLASAATETMAFMPAEEAVGGAISKVFPGLAARAPSEGGANARAIGKAYASFFTKGMADAWEHLKGKESGLSHAFGDNPMAGMPSTWLDYLGHLHAAMKSPTKRAAFELSLAKRSAAAAGEGFDLADPAVAMRLSKEAYVDANRRIFMESNAAVDAYNGMIRRMERIDPETGKPSPLGKAGATAAKILLPIVRVPTNMVKQVMEASLGSAIGAVRLANAYAHGIENLDPKTADSIMRNLKRGSIGLSFMALGYFNPGAVGGYHQPNEKRDDSDVKVGRVKLFGMQVPSLFLHNPFLEAMQIGATIRRVADSKFKKSDKETQGEGVGTMAAAMGLIEEIPLVKEPKELLDLLEPHKTPGALGKLAASSTIPAAVSWAAKTFDKTDDQGEPVKRKPDGFKENFEMAIPGMRQQVPEAVDVKRIPNPRHEAEEAAKAKAYGPLANLSLEEGIAAYQRMVPEDQQKYAPIMRAKIAKARISGDEMQKWIKRLGL